VTRPDQLLDLCASLLSLAARRAPGARALPYLQPAAAALDLAVRRGASGERVEDMRRWIATLGAGARWEVAA
jgi:hypothetical protein